VGDGNLHVRYQLGEERLQPRNIGDARRHVKYLAAAKPLAIDRFHNYYRILGQDKGAHRQAVHRRRGDQAHFAHSGQRQLKSARNRRCGHGQHMHIGFQRFQLLFVGDAKMLLLINDQQTKPVKFYVFGQ
jgi:hypothetical protein